MEESYHYITCSNSILFMEMLAAESACWAFASTGAIEGINKIATGSLVSLSEQELVDCDRTYNTGCSGGLMEYAYNWVLKNHGIDTEEDYPYRSAERSCIKNKLNNRVVTIDGYTDVPAHNEKLLLQAVASQPISAGICGSERTFQLYSKGIFSGPCSTSLDHAVLIVGYGSENGGDYWILKNSWGTNWGMNGYMHLLRNGGDSQGVCGINMLPSYPTKTTPNPPSPSPRPTKCNLLTYCPASSTCCCTRRFFGLCFSYGCCELESAVCCKDHRYCCPHDYPVCDRGTKQCFKLLCDFLNTRPNSAVLNSYVQPIRVCQQRDSAVSTGYGQASGGKMLLYMLTILQILIHARITISVKNLELEEIHVDLENIFGKMKFCGTEPPFSYKSSRIFGEAEVVERLQRVNSIESAECTLKIMKDIQVLVEGCEEVTVRDLMPSLFLPTPPS
ncbi:hypothetical protein KSP39_PZI007346 [Platanthera zijinensis]|uniref:Uncharacterized protein n=1 Tax=Platanthera zijinensis TaxID=2320716 RepID=A0AAP0BR16_9ASPA